MGGQRDQRTETGTQLGTETGTQLGTETGTQLADGNRDAASIDGGHRSLVFSYPCQAQREKHPAGRCTMC